MLEEFNAGLERTKFQDYAVHERLVHPNGMSLSDMLQHFAVDARILQERVEALTPSIIAGCVAEGLTKQEAREYIAYSVRNLA